MSIICGGVRIASLVFDLDGTLSDPALGIGRSLNYALEMFDLRQHFSFVKGGDIGITKRDQLGELRANGLVTRGSTMIGDRAVDIHAARAWGLGAVAVLWGHGTASELLSAAPDQLLDDPAGLIGLFGARIRH